MRTRVSDSKMDALTTKLFCHDWIRLVTDAGKSNLKCFVENFRKFIHLFAFVCILTTRSFVSQPVYVWVYANLSLFKFGGIKFGPGKQASTVQVA